ncbi:hypothetical protein [Nonomuraea maritima]|uniref:hypothetical protein n=1 Tax=Nonomuraea maritima TaxID=683260 RepID=UPI00372085C2
MTENTFDQKAASGDLLGIAMQIPDVVLDFHEVLNDVENDVEQAAQDQDLLRRWSDAAPETRAAILLNMAWLSRDAELGEGDSTAAMYAYELNGYAQQVDDQEAFHGERFPATPLPGPAGALATSLGFDRDDTRISLHAALLLHAAGRR